LLGKYSEMLSNGAQKEIEVYLSSTGKEFFLLEGDM
jgi:hypothetical protein